MGTARCRDRGSIAWIQMAGDLCSETGLEW